MQETLRKEKTQIAKQHIIDYIIYGKIKHISENIYVSISYNQPIATNL